MNQTSIIAASLIVAFIVFVTVRGELPAYLSVFTGAPKAPGTGAVTGSVGGNNFSVGPGGVKIDPVQYPSGGIQMPTPWGGSFSSDFGFGGGGSGFDSPPGVFPL